LDVTKKGAEFKENSRTGRKKAIKGRENVIKITRTRLPPPSGSKTAAAVRIQRTHIIHGEDSTTASKRAEG